MPDEPTNRTSHIPTEHLQGIVERVTYHAEDSGYTVARLKVPSHSDLGYCQLGSAAEQYARIAS